MNIKDAQYIKNPIDNEVNMIKATIDGEKSWIPLDPNNRHYAEILRQVKEEGLTIKDAE
tara:strand:- start:143 stop:319 length:177 start_codon:yes stop_codon:yes gene_type:complete